MFQWWIIEKSDGIEICVNDSHSLNADSPIDVNDERIDICDSDLQPSKTLSSILVTNDGIMICLSDKQSLNAELPVDLTENGIEIWVIEEHPSKLDFSICFIDGGIEILNII